MIENGDVKNNFGFGCAIEVSFALNDTVKFAAGVGGVSYKTDISGAEHDTAMSYYLNSLINVTEKVCVVPEIGVFDNMEDGTGAAEGNSFYLGAKWQVDF